jgi:conserved hypothetical protein
MASIRVLAGILVAIMLALSTAAAPVTSAQASSDDFVAFKKAIRQLYDLKEQAWAAGNAEAIVTKFYASDAISLGEGEPNVLVGREQFRKAYQQFVRDITSVRVEPVRTVLNGHAGWDWANFYFTPKPEKVKEYPPSPIRILFLWSKEHGGWICKGDMYVNGKFENPL